VRANGDVDNRQSGQNEKEPANEVHGERWYFEIQRAGARTTVRHSWRRW
jgi:hypothetical protein